MALPAGWEAPKSVGLGRELDACELQQKVSDLAELQRVAEEARRAAAEAVGFLRPWITAKVLAVQQAAGTLDYLPQWAGWDFAIEHDCVVLFPSRFCEEDSEETGDFRYFKLNSEFFNAPAVELAKRGAAYQRT